MNKLNCIKKVFSIAFLSILLCDCASIRMTEVKNEEQILVTAGFVMKLMSTPEKLAQIKNLKQQELISHSEDNKIYYVYADAIICECIYEGDEYAYQKYLKLQKQIQQNRMLADELNRIFDSASTQNLMR